MNTDLEERKEMYIEKSTEDITEKIIGASYEVSNNLGFGFLEKVYENALYIELKQLGFKVEQQKPITVRYKNNIVGEYIADLFVENQVIVELKSTKSLNDIYKAQLLNYLKATNIKTGLLINFGTPRVEIKRVLNG